MYSKVLTKTLSANNKYNLKLKDFLLNLSCQKHTDNKYVVRDSYDLVSPKFKNYSYAQSTTSKLHLLCDTVGDRLNALASEKPDSVGYKFCLTQTSFTFREVKQRTDEIAQNLLSLGFKKGDRLAIMLPNIPELNLTLLAAASIGVTVVLMNPGYQQVEIDFMLKKTKSKGIVILDNLKTLKHYEILTKICPEIVTTPAGAQLKSKALPDLKHVILVNNRLMKDPSADYKGTLAFNSIEKFTLPNKLEIPKSNFDDPFVMLFTSGTTGFPKAAVLSHYNLLNSAYLEISNAGLLEENKIICIPIPIFHSFGLITGVLEPLIFGGKAVFPSFLPDTLALIKALHNEKCTSVKGAPVIFIDMMNHPERKKHDLSSLKYMLLGASTVPKDIVVKMKQELQIPNIVIGYGMTESSAAGLITRPDYGEDEAFQTIGQPFPFMEVKIVDKERNLVPSNTEGEICLRGYGIMKGYYDEPEKTAEAIDENGWLHTGDIGCMSEHGYVTFKSRAKELIIRGGVNIYPAEIESFIRTNDQVFDAYCFGVPDKRIGEEVCLFVKLKPNSTLTKEQLIEYCNGKIAYFKIPKHVKFVDSFPINANGKVQKFKMTEQMVKELSGADK